MREGGTTVGFASLPYAPCMNSMVLISTILYIHILVMFEGFS